MRQADSPLAATFGNWHCINAKVFLERIQGRGRSWTEADVFKPV